MMPCQAHTSAGLNPVRRLGLLAAVLALLAPLGVGAQSLAVRSFISPAVPGSSVVVNIRLSPPAGATAVTVTENLPGPGGWTATAISDGGTFDSGAITWTLTSDLARSLSYSLEVPASEMGVTRDLEGTAEFATGGSPVMAIVMGDTVIVTTPLMIPPAAFRTIPSPITMPGGSVDGILIGLSIPDGTGIVIVDEQLPTGWVPSNASITEGGVYNANNDTIRWGFFAAPFPSQLSYSLDVPASSNVDGVIDEGQFNITGQISLDTDIVSILGDQRGFIPVVGDVIAALLGQLELTSSESLGLDMNGSSTTDIGDAVMLINAQ